uniref:Uncharacterized protein n=1 Tax=Anguilla anguilla TaxID=7936 RepID=A0A0E9RPF9_ANGAN
MHSPLQQTKIKMPDFKRMFTTTLYTHMHTWTQALKSFIYSANIKMNTC